jgi:hypothetical protein
MTEDKGSCGCGQSGMHPHEGAEADKNREKMMPHGSQPDEKKEGEIKEERSEGLVGQGIKKGTGS